MSVVPASFRARVRSSIEAPVAAFFGRLGFSPNVLTVIGLGIAAVAAWLAASEMWLVAGLVVAFGAVFDLFDGALARATGRTSRFGAFLDSTLDRAGEAVVYIGIAFGALLSSYEPVALLSMTAMAMAFMVSYTRAKAESLEYTSAGGLGSVGLAPREVRTAILVIGLLLSGQGQLQFIPPAGQVCIDYCHGPGYIVLPIALGLIALLAAITSVQRIYFVYQQSKVEPDKENR
jgi:CDP-diacylglycerol--glycerol-3-phosphate 3-phosphatidyltransferase